MKKHLQLIVALLLSASLAAGAATPQIGNTRTHCNNAAQLTLPETPFNASAKTTTPSRLGSIDDGLAVTKDNGIIYEAPEGRTVTYSRSANSIYYTTAGFKVETTYGNLTEVVFTDNNEVYIKEPISKWTTNSYIKGTLENGIITVKLPQVVQPYGSSFIYIHMQTIGEDPNDCAKAENQTLQFSYEDGIIRQLGDDYISLCDGTGEKWYGYGDAHQVYVPYEDTSLKDINLEGEEYNFIYDARDGHKVTVAQDGNDIYIKGMFNALPDAWIKGTTEGSKYVFKPQAIGVIDNSEAYFMPVTVSYEYVYYEQYDYTDSVAVYNKLDQFELEYDAERDLYVTDGDVVILANTSIDVPASTPLAIYSWPAFRKQGDVSNSIPSAPEFYGFYNYFSYWGEYDFDFYLSILSTEGDILDQDKLYYNILLDGEPMIFAADEYGISEDIEDVPYSLTAGQSILIFDLERVIAIFSDGFEKIGVQIVYRPSDDKVFRSDILEYDLSTKEHSIVAYDNPTSVANNLLEKQVKSVENFDLMGRRVTNPSAGLYIQRINYTDGSAKTIKRVL